MELRTLNHHVGYSKLKPSSSSKSASAYLARSAWKTRAESLTVELISPLAKYRRMGAISSESGLSDCETRLAMNNTASAEDSAKEFSLK